LPITGATVLEMQGHLFAHRVRELGRRGFEVAPGRACALLPQGDALKLYAGAARALACSCPPDQAAGAGAAGALRRELRALRAVGAALAVAGCRAIAHNGASADRPAGEDT